MKWPEPRHRTQENQKNGDIALEHEDYGWNTAIDACKKAIEESSVYALGYAAGVKSVKQSPPLVALDEKDLNTELTLHTPLMAHERQLVINCIKDKFGVPESGLVKEENRQRLWRIIQDSTLWDDCVLEAYEGDVEELVENILLTGFKYGTPSPALPSPLNCTHANEVPNVCKCPEDCYCKKNTCFRAELNLEEIEKIMHNEFFNTGLRKMNPYDAKNIKRYAQAISNRLKGEK